MAINFPDSPINGDSFTSNNKTWVFDGTVWNITSGTNSVADDAITTAKIVDANVTAAKLASGAAVTNIGYTPANIASPTFTGTVVLPSTTSIGTVSSTEIGYVDGVTSAIQTQLDSKLTATTAVTSNRNAVINGAFNVWQRGTSFANASASPYYTADRWQSYRTAGATGLTISRQTSELDGFTYSLRAQRDSGNTSVNDMIVSTTFETQNVRRYHNKFVTLSFYARRGANYSSASSVLSYAILTGTGTDGNIANGLTGQANAVSSNATLTTTFQRFTVTTSAVLPTSKTQLGVIISSVPVGTASTNDWFEITGVQLEAGAVATPFEFEDFGVTLQKCQRYYQKSYNQQTPPGSTGVSSGVVTTGILSMSPGLGFAGKTYYATPMRVSPTVTTYSYSAGTTGVISDAGSGGDKTAGSASVIWQGENGFDVYNLSGIGITSNYGFMYHYTASAEL